MRVAIVAVALALVLPAAAAAGGTREAKALEPLASDAAGKNVEVYCLVLSDTPEDGFAHVGGSDVYIDATYCKTLERALAAPKQITTSLLPEDVGVALEVLLHEATHAKGIADEATAECVALRETAAVAIRFLGLRGRRVYLHDMMNGALQNHAAMPPQYHGTCG